MATYLLALLVAAGPLSALGARARVSPVQKVIALIDDMAAKTKKADEELKANFEEFAKFCDDEATAKDYAMKDSKEAIEELTATIIDSKAVIDTATATVGDLSTKISDIEGEISTSASLREKERETFVATEGELVKSTEELANAQKVIKKSMALIQARGGKIGQEDRDVLSAVLGGLGEIIEASFVNPKQKRRMAALLQDQEDAEEDSELGAGTMNVNAILDTLGEMEDKAKESLEGARKAESEAQFAHASLKQGLQNEIDNAKSDMAENTQKSAATGEALATAEKDLAVEKKGLAEDESYSRELKRDCQTRAGEFELETKDNAAEIEALGKAKAIMTKKFGGASSFLQTGSMLRVRSGAKAHDAGDVEAKARALRAIEKLGRKLHKTSLIALAYRAAEDPFAKIRGMIEEMIEKLLQEAAEEADQKAFCDKEIGESKASKADKEGKLGKVGARLEKADAATAELTEAIASLSKEVAENDAAMAAATEVRQKEKSAFAVVEKELSESQEACAAATEVLKEYYEGASLLQVSAKTRVRARDSASAGAEGDGSGILGMLEVAEDDFAKGLAEARTVEETAASEYEKLMQDGKMLKMTKEMEVKGKMSEVKSLKTTLTDLSSDKEGLTGELDAVLAYLDKLKPQCETKVPSYAERKAARDQEIEGLKGALETLG